jgi:hypothetical protein
MYSTRLSWKAIALLLVAASLCRSSAAEPAGRELLTAAGKPVEGIHCTAALISA